MLINRANIKEKLKTLIFKVLVLAGVIIIIFFAVKLISFIRMPNSDRIVTEAQARKVKYNEKTFGEQEVKKKDLDRFVELIDNYYNFCNNKEYEKAYALIHEDCKNKLFPTLEIFKEDVDSKFDKLKRYRYKNLSNVGDDYVYNLTLFDDVLAYGTNKMPEEIMYNIVIKDSKDGAKLSLDGYISTDNTRISTKFEGGMIAITKKDIYYDHIDITLEITNNTDKIIIIPKDDIEYVIRNGKAEKKYEEYSLILYYTYLYALPNSTNESNIRFTKSFDTIKYKDYALNFNSVYYISSSKSAKVLTAILTTEDYLNNNIPLSIKIGL